MDKVHDARQQEAVLMRAEVPRTGPDDLTYPPVATSAWPAGTELVIEAADESGRWVRVVASDLDGPIAHSNAGAWLPRSAIAKID